MTSERAALAEPIPDDRRWYKDAIIYELRVRSFYDSNGDGIGDLPGLASRLDYLLDLGVTALWLLPICPSPMRDDGYDIADYTDVQPELGSLAAFENLLREAHARGLRVITELVMNHTSDQHPWFQRARRAPPGSPERAFYVWSETPERYRDARIIFQDFETSNWSWDPVARAYYWHRFYSHQPDLNFENPDVRAALLRAVDFWLALGVDGLRLDAIPYLFEEEGTACENLPATHAFLRELRAHVDARFEGRMLLAEANQWPEDAAAYFGAGDECHMNFHFPIMPRMFMAIRMEDRFPIVDILAQTPELDPSCQWALFLRNHDELTLEMVTDEERDYMIRAYAREPAMRINLGIRRRLAPLCGNDRRIMELLNGLLFSLPGTPVLYYGDEIGMGDNVFLGDRNGVRTPMQWSADRNAGFSRANPQRLVLPIVIDPAYHYESINVEAQQDNPSSLLWWMKRLIALRKRHKAFGRGTIELLSPENPRVLSFVRKEGDETVLVVANLSRRVQYVELDLSAWKGTRPVELFGHTSFPPVGEGAYLLTLGAHAFYWFSLDRPGGAPEAGSTSEPVPPLVEGTSLKALLGGGERQRLEEAIRAFLPTRRWFDARDRRIAGVRVVEALPLGDLTLLLVAVELDDQETETYVLPLAFVGDGRARAPHAVVANLRLREAAGPPVEGQLVDAVEEGDTARGLLEAILEGRRIPGREGDLLASSAVAPGDDAQVPAAELRDISALHESAAIRCGDRYLLKLYRRMEDGVSPELEIGRFLTARASGLTAAVAGALEYRRGTAEPMTVAVLQGYVPNEGTAWSHARGELRHFYERVLTHLRDRPAPPAQERSVARLAAAVPPAEVRDDIGAYLDAAALLGHRTAELHLALASEPDLPAFAPEPYATLDQRGKYQSMRNLVGRCLRLLRAQLGKLPPAVVQEARALAGDEARILRRFEPLLAQRITAQRIRIHGDYHLGQVLYTGKDFVIIDLDGGRRRSLPERRRKRSPLRDVAAMVRSFHRVAFTTLTDPGVVRESDLATATPWADLWQAQVAAAFVRAYLDAAGGATFVPRDGLAYLLDVFVIEQAFRELHHELEGDGRRADIPLHGLIHLLGVAPGELPRSPGRP